MPSFRGQSASVAPSLRTLRVAQEATAVGRLVYAATGKLPVHERLTLGSQMRRAAVSVYANIAEGHARPTAPDALRFMAIAAASLRELQAHIEFAHSVALLDASDAEELNRRMRWVDQLLTGYREALTQHS